MLDISLRLATILVFILWWINWWITEKKADKEKPKLRSKETFFSRQNVERYGAWVFYFIVFLQLMGLHLFPMQSNEQIFRFVCVLVGFLFLHCTSRIINQLGEGIGTSNKEKTYTHNHSHLCIYKTSHLYRYNSLYVWG